MVLKTKSILAPVEDSDGYRISVMSRHTLPDGSTPHPGITSEKYDLWQRSVAPPASLVGDHYKRGLAWSDFERRYLAHIRSAEVVADVRALAVKGLSEVVTILCVEEKPDQCHRRLLAEECKRLEPTLELDIH